MATLDLLCNLIIRAFLVMILCLLPQSCREHLICKTRALHQPYNSPTAAAAAAAAATADDDDLAAAVTVVSADADAAYR